MIEGVRYLYGFTMDGLNVEQLNDEIINLAGIYVMSIIIISHMVVLGLFLKKFIDIGAKIQALETVTSEHNAISIDKLQALEKPIKRDNRDSQTKSNL